MIEHGSFELELTGNILTLSAYDAWNYQTAIRWSKETKEIVSSIKSHPWSSLCDLTEWELATPEIHPYVLELNVWLDANNLKYLAIVYKTAIQQSLLEKTNRVFTNVEVKYFTDVDEGETWLKKVSTPANTNSNKAGNG